MTVISVGQLNRYVKSLLEGDTRLADVYIRGEISNFVHHYASGHLYMTLKDGTAAVKTVMFRGNASRLRFEPENGMSVLVRGRISLYERDGSFRLYVEEMQPDGAGALQVAFDQLKKKLEAEGLFAESRKRPLPRYPMRVGVITSPTGAAVRDIFNVLGRRFPLAEVIFTPVLVQGEGAAQSLVAAIENMNATDSADVLIVGRGGGSIEDLWAFNEEPVARAVAGSHIPVISAVGHETDFTICDFVADCRAPTPSAAAELAVPDAVKELQALDETAFRLQQALQRKTASCRQALTVLSQKRCLTSPDYYVQEQSLRLDLLSNRLGFASQRHWQEAQQRLSSVASKLDALSPLKVLGRGYAITFDDKGKPLTSVKPLHIGETLSLRYQDGSAEVTVSAVHVKE